MTDGSNDLLLSQAASSGDSMTALLQECLPDAPPMELVAKGSRASLSPSGQAEKGGGVPLRASTTLLAWLRIDVLCRLDATGSHLAVDKSKIWVVADVDSTPIFRFEYLYDAEWVPHSHIQVHGERGALAHLLSQTGHPRPHNMSALHLPTGGARFRPNLEDVLQFLITDCGFDALDSWRQAVDRERAQWRRTQTRTACRGLPEVAAEQLRSMGYEVRAPAGGHPPPGDKALGAW